MKQGLTKREKVLLFIVTVMLLALAAFYFVIQPIYDDYTAKLEEYESLCAERDLLDLRLQNEAAVRMLQERGKETYDEIKSTYPAVMPNEDSDRLLTGICVQNRLSPVALTMSAPARLDGSKEPIETNGTLVVVQASMNLIGDYDSLKNLIRAVERIDYIHIDRLSFNAPQDADQSAPPQSASPNISVVFEITMLNEAQ